jgi:hypothetical protein
MSYQQLKKAKIHSNSNVIIEYITSNSLQIRIGLNPNLSEVEKILKSNSEIFILNLSFLDFEETFGDIFESSDPYFYIENSAKESSKTLNIIAKFIENFKQITQLEITYNAGLFMLVKTIDFLENYIHLSNIKSISLIFNSSTWSVGDKLYNYIPNLIFIHHLSISKRKPFEKDDYRTDEISLHKLLNVLNTLPNLKSFHTLNLNFSDNNGHTLGCETRLEQNTSLVNIYIPQLDPLPKIISERNYKRCKTNLISILSSREYEDSLFYRNYLPLDMIKVILNTTDLMNIFIYNK